jgi:hypothetical protein
MTNSAANRTLFIYSRSVEEGREIAIVGFPMGAKYKIEARAKFWMISPLDGQEMKTAPAEVIAFADSMSGLAPL